MTARQATPLAVGARVRLDVGPVGHGGFCVARLDGRVVFVRHALPGERVVAEVTEDRGGSFLRADAVRVLTASPDRVDAPCPVAGPGGCGGCDWQHAAPAAQRELKAAVVREQLARVAGITADTPGVGDLVAGLVVEELPGGPLRWRTRVQLAVGPDGRAGLHAHRSDRVVPLDDCPITVAAAVGPVLARSWPPGATVEVAHDAAGATHASTVVETRGRDSGHGGDQARDRGRDQGRGRGRAPGRHDRAVRRTRVLGSGTAVQDAAGRRWRVAADGFWQVHPAAADTFARVVGEWAQAPRGGLAWDLYGGVGLFAAGLAEQVGITGSVTVVESSPRAVGDGAANLADLPQVTLRAGRVERVLAGLDGAPDVIVADPPRKGLGRALAHQLAGRAPGRVVHVACDPASLARDVAAFAERGYRLTALRAFDAFPMTHHVECVALLTPAGRDA